MAYISNADIETRLGYVTFVQLTNDTGSGEPDLEVADEARLGALGEVDSFLGCRWAVPVDTAAHPELAGLLRSVTLDLVAYRLHARRADMPPEVRLRYEATMRWLAAVARGEVCLPAMQELASNPASGVAARATGPARVMSRSEMEDI